MSVPCWDSVRAINGNEIRRHGGLLAKDLVCRGSASAPPSLHPGGVSVPCWGSVHAINGSEILR